MTERNTIQLPSLKKYELQNNLASENPLKFYKFFIVQL